MNVLLSVKPIYVEAILKGIKIYEFRKAIFAKKPIEKVYVYSTAPVKKIVCSFEIGEIKTGNPDQLWSEFEKYSGLTHEEFTEYFKGHNKGFAIKIERVSLFEKPIDPKETVKNFLPPQSFCYIDELPI
jgi:type I restriction enzyme, S subunit